MRITAEELQWAFDEFDRRKLRHVNFSHDFALVRVMGKYTKEDPHVSAGCETGIKLGLLIAERRQSEDPRASHS